MTDWKGRLNAVNAKSNYFSERHGPSRNAHPGGNTATDFILVVDADSAARRAVTDYFKDHVMSVYSVASPAEAVRYSKESYPALIILDVNVGQDDGLDVLRDIRLHSDVPVIVTQQFRKGCDRVVSLELGADAYVSKPYNLRELLARVRAVLRREAIGHTIRSLHVERAATASTDGNSNARGDG